MTDKPEPTAEHIDAVAYAIIDYSMDVAERGIPADVWESARDDAEAVLGSTRPDVHAAMLDALVRAGVLAEETDYDVVDVGFITCHRRPKRRHVTPWEPTP